MKKIKIIFFLSLINFSTFGQNVISDSLVYFLVAHSIEDAERVKIFGQPKIINILSDDKHQGLIDKYFKQEDAAFIKYQIENALVKKWEKKSFKPMRKVRITKSYTGTFPFLGFKGKDTYFISLPIFSKDLKTAIICYDTFHKFKFYKESTGAGFIAVWRQENGEWKLIESDMLWITQKRKQEALSIPQLSQSLRSPQTSTGATVL